MRWGLGKHDGNMWWRQGGLARSPLSRRSRGSLQVLYIHRVTLYTEKSNVDVQFAECHGAAHGANRSLSHSQHQRLPRSLQLILAEALELLSPLSTRNRDPVAAPGVDYPETRTRARPLLTREGQRPRLCEHVARESRALHKAFRVETLEKPIARLAVGMGERVSIESDHGGQVHAPLL